VKSALYAGQVYHKRLRPAVHSLRYRVFSLLLNLDEIDELHTRLRFFSRNRWNLVSFYDKDFGETTSEALIDYVQRKLAASGITERPHSILLSCYPRIFGYTFNPLSLFYCLDDKGEAFAIIHEVHNTFGERHAYVLPVDVAQQTSAGNEKTNWITQASQKALFVSPFAHMKMNYEFRLNVPDEKQVIVIRVNDESGHLLTASYTANRRMLTTSSLLKCFLSIPVMTFKVTAGIHWEALRLWLKKVPWFSHQAKHTFSGNNLKNP